MFYMVQMFVNRPESVSDEKWAELRTAEMNYAQDLMREGKFRHVWRVVGDVSNVSIFDVDTHAELHDILQNLPLFPYMDVKVTPLAEHPSGLPEMYAYAS
ncbi:muconolactone delta-isomerase [Corynebacterium maris DSM 45190]|uniref:muconolactone Delta-isomerase n=1 Tax=Corynebacterium maris DSM 45190 TaxID=1224163 RepID=S5TF72_9CORY|nr:muconolactone Delta-isomerase family protein [Corynebacterium maris]AGS33561.1 muconolactone delta-isomerase [Corynebacterium maris DSM 45190]